MKKILAAAAILGFAGLIGMAQPDEPTGLWQHRDHSTIDPEAAVGDDVWSGYKCIYKVGCPAGLLINRDFSYSGCTKVPVLPACNGSCSLCAGDATAMGYLCVPKEGDTCTFAPREPSMKRGVTTYVECEYASTPPAGEPRTTPNACYCTGPSSTSQDPCGTGQCIKLGS